LWGYLNGAVHSLWRLSGALDPEATSLKVDRRSLLPQA